MAESLSPVEKREEPASPAGAVPPSAAKRYLAWLRGHPEVPPPARRTLAWLRDHWDLLAVVLLMLTALPTLWLSPRTLTDTGTEINLVDDSWILDTSFKAARGLWFGRDVAFTYGPLFQWLSSAPARGMGISMGAIYDSCLTLPLWLTFLFGYLTLRLLLPEQPAWKRFVLLLLLGIFWAPLEGRAAVAILLFAVFLRGWYAVEERGLNPALLGCGAAVLCAAAFLYSTDTGVYALAALGLSLAGVAWEGLPQARLGSNSRQPQPWQSYALALVTFAAASLALVVAINAFMARPFDFRFWKDALAIFFGYRWIEAEEMARPDALHMLGALLAAALVFLARSVTADKRDRSITARSGFLLSAFVFAGLALQSGLVRSDPVHTVISSYAAVFLTGVVLFSFASRIASTLAVVLAVSGSLMLGGPPSLLTSLRYNYRQLRHPSTACPQRFVEFDRFCYPDEFATTLQTTTSFLQQHSGPRDFIAVFPFQNMFGVAARRSVAGGVLQSYLVSGPGLSQLDIAGLERATAPAGLYLPDGDLSIALDGVPNFTRTPEVWFWMFRHYWAEQELSPGIFGLQRDDSRASRIRSYALPLAMARRSYPVRQRRVLLDLGPIAWPREGADFLRLRLIVHYPSWWKLRKPARLALEIERADASDDVKPFIVEPNVASEIWFYPWDDTELARYFAGDEHRWRAGPPAPEGKLRGSSDQPTQRAENLGLAKSADARPAIVHLRLLITPLDWVSVQPHSIEVQSADTVRVTLTR